MTAGLRMAVQSPGVSPRTGSQALTLHARWVANIYEVIFVRGRRRAQSCPYVRNFGVRIDLAGTFREATLSRVVYKAAGGEK